MRIRYRFTLALVACLALVSSGAASLDASAAGRTRPLHPSIEGLPHGLAQVCRTRGPHRAACHAHVVTHSNAPLVPLASSTPPATAYTPAQMRHAYGFDQVAGTGSGQTIAIVDAYDAPNIAADLHNFDVQFGLADPPSFTKATPQGTPAYDAGWEEEISLDVEWAHAIAPAANILLVEAASNSFADLYGAVDYASAHAGTVSMSWGGSEYSTETADDSHFSNGAVTFFASAGDSGHVTGYPAASPYVSAVGGTHLVLQTDGTWSSESTWSCTTACSTAGGTGGDTSPYEAQPSWQTGFVSTGGKRAYADVAYNADPNTGVAILDSGQSGWLQIGGTSAGAPQWAALAAIIKGQSAQAAVNNSNLYGQASGAAYAQNYHDITTGQNGTCGTPCNAGVGYDEPTGVGSPIANSLINALGGPPKPKLGLTGLPATLAAGSPATGTVSLLNADGSAQTSCSATTVNVTSSDAANSTLNPAAVSVAGGSSCSGSFQFSDRKAESVTVSASANGFTSATQSSNIVAGPAVSLAISPSTAQTTQVGGTIRFTASGADAYNNPADVSATAWSVGGGIGGVSPSTGSSTTFTANTAGSGSVSASLAGVPGSQSTAITVNAGPRNPIANAGFEAGTFMSWLAGGGKPSPTVSTARPHSGSYSALLGYVPASGEPSGDSYIQQQFAVPAAGGTLSFYAWEYTTDSVTYDWQTCQIRSTSGKTLSTLFKEARTSNGWVLKSASLNNWKGTNVVIWCNVHEDGWGDQTYMYVDDFSVK